MSRTTREPPADISPEVLAAFAERRADGPVVMLNMLKFRPDGGLQSYLEYGQSVRPLIEGVGGSIEYQSMAAESLIGGQDWDMIVLVRYPTRGAFLEMVESDEYRAIAHLRENALEGSVLYATDPV